MSGSISSSDFSETEEGQYTFTNPIEQDRLLKNSNIFKQSKDQPQNSCARHPGKKAKYYVQHDKRTLFCSKCALNLALRGVKIEETQETQQELQREQRILQFQDNLKIGLENCQTKQQELQNLENLCLSQVEEQRENCCNFFEQVIVTATQLKQTYISKFENDNLIFIQSIKEHKHKVSDLEKQLKQFQFDIELNHESIVKRMQMKPFEEIMGRYDKKFNITKQQLTDLVLSLHPKPLSFEQAQILSYLNKMCYNLLLKTDHENENVAPSIKQSHTDSCTQNPSIDMKVFEILEGEDIYQSTYSNPIKDNPLPSQSPIRMPIMKKGHAYSNPLSTIQNSRRESNMNTPESWQQRTCIQKVLQNNTPNERETVSHNVSMNEQPKNQIEIQQKYQEKQKTSNEIEKNNNCQSQPIIQNLSCLQLEKIEEKIVVDRNSYDERELTPKHQKNLTVGPQTFKLNSNHQSQRCKKYVNILLAQFQYPANNLFEQKKGQYDSIPQQKSLTPHHTQSQQQLQPDQRLGQHLKQESTGQKRSNSKFAKQPSIDQNEGKRQFILQNIAQYTTQPSNEESLKDRIFKELCSHPGESVYNQVLKLNNQTKLKNQKYINKENSNEYSSTVRSKNNTFLCLKK